MMPAKTPVLLIQGEFFRRIEESATLPQFYDDVPEDAEFPYIEGGEFTEIPDNSHGSFGRQTVHTLHVWSRERGYAEGVTIVDRLTAEFDHKPMTLDGFVYISVKFEFLQTLKDPDDPDLRHIVVRFRITTEQED